MQKTPVSEFDFYLPDELIAQYPADRRAESRLLVLDRASGGLSDRIFREIDEFFTDEDFLVVNNTRVMKARMFGQKSTGGRVEVFILEDKGGGDFLALTRGKVRVGTEIIIDGVPCKVCELMDDGVRLLNFADADVYSLMEKSGHIPLPPYIRRDDEQADETRYQTVYSDSPRSVAAPTAGLHFDEEILNKLKGKGVEVVQVSLDIGLGTFRPVTAEYAEDHTMHTERYTVSNEAAKKINELKAAGKRLCAVGTTAVRTLESASNDAGIVSAGSGETNIFIKPGYEYKTVDRLITNFHLPKSTLIMLVSAFAGAELVQDAYRHAVENRYRFFSYGDGMLII